MPYGDASGVAAHCINILGSDTAFSETTKPRLTDVDLWLDVGESIIDARLSAAGYNVPVSTAAAVYNWVVDLNNLFAAAKVEMSRTNVSLRPGERTRGLIFEKQFKDGLDELCSLDLTLMGLDRVSSDAIYVGGTSVDAKEVWEDDTDRVKPRNRRGQFNFDDTIRPDD